MRCAVRSILAFFLTIALIIGGVPFAHAMPVNAIPAQPIPILAHGGSPGGAGIPEAHHHDAGHGPHHQIHDEAAADIQRDDVDPGKKVDDLCKGSKCCSMCATAYVEPSLRHLNVDRVSMAVRYDMVTIAHPQAVIFVDPGIPIA